MEQTTFLTFKEACKILCMAPDTLYKYTHKRLITFHKIGKNIIFKLSDLLAFIEKYRCPTALELEETAFSNLKNGRKS